MPAPDIIVQLVATFEQHRDAYRKSDFSEVATRCLQPPAGAS
jgi:hypothetical protein